MGEWGEEERRGGNGGGVAGGRQTWSHSEIREPHKALVAAPSPAGRGEAARCCAGARLREDLTNRDHGV
jgi:hypothetical protein